jgi:hypothetical protein
MGRGDPNHRKRLADQPVTDGFDDDPVHIEDIAR